MSKKKQSHLPISSAEITLPDVIEKQTDNPKLIVVAVGASAGGLQALKEMFNVEISPVLPKNICFIVLSHQQPGAPSLLSHLIAESTSFPVSDVVDGLLLEPNNIYVCPSNGETTVEQGIFKVAPLDAQAIPTRYHPIDRIFRNIAAQYQQKAVGVVLSGTGSDGSVGLEKLKELDGLVIAQDPATASFAGMPSNAIKSGLVDFILPAETIIQKILEYASNYPPLITGRPGIDIPSNIYNRICNLLRTRTGHDFSLYKTNTLLRRIQRRMTIHQQETPENYLDYLNENPHEVDLLFKELLIRVTNFFRDRPTWEILAKGPLKDLLLNRNPSASIRFWVPGCATGEEAYTLAIVLRRCMNELKIYPEVQIFATDLDNAAIEIARKGIYPLGIKNDLTAAELKQFFTQYESSFQIKREVRDMIIFAAQNLIKDPPFTKVDLISCRNLLIYLRSELQERLFPMFYYALNPNGYLLLGLSESTSDKSQLFTLIDKANKVYQRKDNAIAPATTNMPRNFPNAPLYQYPRLMTSSGEQERHPSFTSQVLKLLANRFAPVCIVINGVGDIYYIHGKTGELLEPNEGRPRNNLLEMAREGLRVEIATALHQLTTNESGRVERTAILSNKKNHLTFTVSIERIVKPEILKGLLLVILVKDAKHKETKPKNELPHQPDRVVSSDSNIENIASLKRQLSMARESYQTIVEELETSNEELRSTNEELQSTNEELQSTNEELETSKEEMQSLNEELSTVNNELNLKLTALSQASDDMQNLLNSTDIATIFLDNHLCIKRFTDNASKLIALRDTDIGRPISDLVAKLRYTDLYSDAETVLSTLIPRESQIESVTGDWYLMRILPYRTTQNVIDGLVCTFVNIERIKRAEKTNRVLQQITRLIPEQFVVIDKELKIVTSSLTIQALNETSQKSIYDQSFFSLNHGELDTPELREAINNLTTIKQEFSDLIIGNWHLKGQFLDIAAADEDQFLILMSENINQ